jgi:heat-inducible transcriptional repressor
MSDTSDLHGLLTERQKAILALIIREYIQSAQPVGSKALLNRYGLELSSATIRNEMAALSEMGYLRQPHTSAGRIPTEEGYRYFVGELMGHTELPRNTRRTISHQFYQVRNQADQWMRLAASVLANQSQAASLVTAPQTHQARFKHIELIEIRGRQVLMVLVLAGGEVRQQMLTLAEPVTQDQLSAAAARISALCQGMDREAILTLAQPADPLDADVLTLVQDEMRAMGALSGEVYRDGLINVLAEPEFAEANNARKALRVLEERSVLEDLLNQTVMTSEVGVVQVLIGGEDTWEELADCSVVLARYGAPELATGMLGVLGPVRMRYGNTISAVRFVAGLLSQFVVATHED